MKKRDSLASDLDELEFRFVHTKEDRDHLASVYRGRAAALERYWKVDGEDWEDETTDVRPPGRAA